MTSANIRMLKMVAVVSATALAVIFAVLIIMDSYDPPVDAGGGTIRGKTNASRSWSEVAAGRIYGAPAGDKSYVVLYGLVDSQNNPAPSPLPVSGSWIASFSTQYPNAISLCSDVVSPPAALPACTGQPLSDPSTVYLQVNDSTDTNWEPKLLNHKLLYHDHHPGCGKSCEDIAQVTITTDSGSKTYGPYHCTDVENCGIKVGK